MGSDACSNGCSIHSVEDTRFNGGTCEAGDQENSPDGFEEEGSSSDSFSRLEMGKGIGVSGVILFSRLTIHW